MSAESVRSIDIFQNVTCLALIFGEVLLQADDGLWENNVYFVD